MCRVKSTHGALTKIKDATHKVYMKKEKKNSFCIFWPTFMANYSWLRLTLCKSQLIFVSFGG